MSNVSDLLLKLQEEAKARLRSASWNLARCRRGGIYSNRDERLLREAETELLAALDHSADIAAMTVVSF